MKKDKFEEMTARIISQLEKGVVPWRRTWNQITMGAARNHFTGHIYRGINRFMLDGFEVPRFATFHQISGAGHRVKKGAKSLPIYFWKMLFFDADGKRVESKKEAEKVVPFVSEYRVFNVLDIEGFTAQMFKEEKPEAIPARIEECEAILSGNPHEVTKGEPAYSPLFDKLFMPDLAEFESPEKFYHTYFHELSHWTGHSSRLNREIRNSFGSEKYSREELVAEMSASFLAAHCGIVVEELVKNTAAYLQSWINVLQGDARLLMTAASAAEKAAAFLLQSEAKEVPLNEELQQGELVQAA